MHHREAHVTCHKSVIFHTQTVTPKLWHVGRKGIYWPFDIMLLEVINTAIKRALITQVKKERAGYFTRCNFSCDCEGPRLLRMSVAKGISCSDWLEKKWHQPSPKDRY